MHNYFPLNCLYALFDVLVLVAEHVVRIAEQFEPGHRQGGHEVVGHFEAEASQHGIELPHPFLAAMMKLKEQTVVTVALLHPELVSLKI